MKKITTVFYVFAVLTLFVLISGCGSSKKETETGEISDNDADTGKKELSECSPESGTPCLDSSSGLVWSAKSHGVMYRPDTGSYCYNLSEGGFYDWHAPSINQLRTLIKNCKNTETGGECKVSNECDGRTCKNDACAGCPSKSNGYYSKFGDSDILWTNAYIPNEMSNADSWNIDFSNGSVQIGYSYIDHKVRCVRNNSAESGKEGASSSDEACFKVNDRVWSNRVMLIWSDAADYCENLNECGISDWHLPTIDELRTLSRGSVTDSGGACGVTDNCLSYDECYDEDICLLIVFANGQKDGRYNELGDINWFWSSSAPPDKPNSAWGIDFYRGSMDVYDTEHFTADGCNVRCVSSGKDNDPNGCASGEYKCLHSQSLRCKDGFWTPYDFCLDGCDSSTGKCK